MKTRILLVLLIPLIANAAPGPLAAPAGGPGLRAGSGSAVCDGTGSGGGAGPGLRAGGGPGQRRGGGGGRCGQQGTCALAAVRLSAPTTLPVVELADAVEEERVARDLYQAAAARWGSRVFAHLAGAEARHEAALLQVAASVQAALPAAAPGTYASPGLQKLYTDSLALLNKSEVAALRVGALVEESDIADLRRLATVATDDGTRAVLAQLEAASTRHLNAFVRNLARWGESYQPQVLAAADFAALIAPRG